MTKRSIIKIGILTILFVTISSCALIRHKKFKNSIKSSSIVSSEFPVNFKFTFDEWIFIKAKLNNSTVAQNFFLDTGSPCTYCFQTKKIANLHSKKLLHFMGVNVDYGYTDVEIETIKYNNLAYLVSDLAMCWKKNNSGYIGVNAMHNSIWEFNFQDTTIRISDTLSDFRNIENSYKVRFKPLSEQETPVIKITINNGDTITALLDTGNDKVVQLNSKFNLEGIKHSYPECVQTSYFNLNQFGEHMKRDSIVETNFIKANSLKIGDLELNSVILNQTPLDKRKNLIGLGFLQNFIVTIDWKHHILYLKPFTDKKSMTKKSTYGFTCEKIDSALKVFNIFRNDLADKEGIKSGDLILKINNRAAQDIDQKFIDSINSDLPTDQEIVVQFKTKELRFKKHDIFN